ncbi:hypothetical protein [Nocardia brasiliensis]|uniref:hypothetical protein n=1 Tax=Nocardia brasiliensis TaxID=37326 RepID=UPI00366B7232
MRSHEIWHAEYLRLCEYAYEDWDNYFTEEQARHVAQGWADGNLNLDAWAEGVRPVTSDTLAEAEKILDDLRMCAQNHWPHADEPWCQVAGMERVVMFLRTQL